MNFIQALEQRWLQQRTLLCVGLDPDITRLPACIANAYPDEPQAIFEFCRQIVDATADLVCAFKPQIAYFAAARAETVLEQLIDHIHRNHPDIPVILDAKRGDIGSTAEQYAHEAFVRYNADAVTVNPYLGTDSIEPYLRYTERGVIVLCRTSNPGGSDLQFMECHTASSNGSRPLYQHVAQLAVDRWNTHGNCALVVGATFPDEIAVVRKIIGDMPLLVPGIGAQGGDIQATVQAGKTPTGGLMINSSRAILYASGGENFAATARRIALTTRDSINQYR